MPSPQTPLPERARGFENLQLFLAPLLLLWEKGLGDEGKRFVSQSGEYTCSMMLDSQIPVQSAIVAIAPYHQRSCK
jgi:hypothetical protein